MPNYTALVVRKTYYQVSVEAKDEDAADLEARNIVEFGGSGAKSYNEHVECIQIDEREEP